ncbi:MAG: prolyl-tRNA synthetase associated domain-containing protein [Alphaproteobacteria bacterium]|nr:prolyl-tRNA synthetase associated domain-containing protein [Alphaproteobacteria bacterium]
MPATEAQLLARFDALGIAHKTYRHPAVFTVEEAKALRGALPGAHCKSLFLKDRQGGLWLAVMLEERRLDLKKLSDRLGAPRFSFASAELLLEALGVTPGSVTPFAAINDTARRVRVVLDAQMLAQDPLNYHPLHNAATTAVAPDGLLRFLADCGHEPRILHLSDLERDAAP